MTELAQRQPRVRDPQFLAFLRKLPCACCGAPPPCDAAHIRAVSPAHGKRSTGMAEKPDDRWATPLKHSCHMLQHSMNEVDFWEKVGRSPFDVAISLYARYLAEGGPGPVKPRKPRARPKKRDERRSKIAVPKITSRGFRKGPKRKIPSRKLR